MQKESECYYFKGEDGCDICASFTGYTENSNFLAHPNCDCETKKNASNSNSSKKVIKTKLVNKEIESKGTSTETREGDAVWNITSEQGEFVAWIDEHFQGEMPTSIELEQAFDISIYTFEKDVSADFPVTLEPSQAAVAKVTCNFQTIRLKVDICEVYDDATEALVGTADEDIIVILSTTTFLEHD